MANIEQLVEKFREKLLIDQEIEKYKAEVVNPIVDRIFAEDFSKIFENLVEEINNKLNFKIVGYQQEGKHRFVVSGQYHRIFFQKNKAEFSDGIANVSIIPIYVWKGVTKHLGPISFFVNIDSKEVKWNIPFESIEEYSGILFSKLVEDEDFFM